MPRLPVGGPGVRTRRYQLKLPEWMLEALQAEAARTGEDASALIRRAIIRVFFSGENGNSIPMVGASRAQDGSS